MFSIAMQTCYRDELSKVILAAVCGYQAGMLALINVCALYVLNEQNGEPAAQIDCCMSRTCL